MIKLQLIGHLGRDCVVNTVNGKSVMNFTVAHSERYRDNQNIQQEKTIWVDCSYWSDKTGIAPYLKKGTQVYLEGAPDVRTYSKNDGTTGAALTVRVFNIQLLGGRSEGSQGQQSSTPAESYGAQAMTNAEVNDMNESGTDDLPF